ncbi:hypothetical protein EB819_03135 [Cloacibacterium normanense]|nr:hypothetical protein EB819_03135 [Cloacibacterium normanense]SDO94616.1 hypothetical protein SAMN04489756_1362 [Cloacibacterium normanense]
MKLGKISIENSTIARQGFCNSGAKLQSSTVVLRLNFCAKLKICASIAPPSQSPETSDVAKSAPLLLQHRFGGLHPQMLLVATRTSHICEFAKSQERKQTSFSGLRKSAEPLCAILSKDPLTN